ncbi:MAG TPA: GNAT family N-acetyltransferase [Jatrophihabitans sp.]|jgi:GNAT superfamily N-acetyltransferase
MVTVADATSDRWQDVVAVMGSKGDPARCWCQFFRGTNADWNAGTSGARRAALRAQLESGPPPGVLAYDDDAAAVGWCGLAPRADYPRLARSLTAKATQDEDGLWALTCFVVPVRARRQGVSGVLLDGAVELARRYGARTIEAYPIDLAIRTPSSSELYHGAFHVFQRSGFVEVARPKSDRPTVRLTL